MPKNAACSIAHLGLGSNLGDRLGAMRAALEALHEHPEIEADSRTGVASLYETCPVGVTHHQPDYLNSAIRVKTTLSPLQLLDAVLSIEATLGRVRRERWEPRLIDIDLLLYEDLVINHERLSVPHPRLHQRRFVLEPLAEIASKTIHPVLGVTIEQLARTLSRLTHNGHAQAGGKSTMPLRQVADVANFPEEHRFLRSYPTAGGVVVRVAGRDWPRLSRTLLPDRRIAQT